MFSRTLLIAVAGGISPYTMSIEEDISSIDRFQDIPPDGAMCDLVWSDPAARREGVSVVHEASALSCSLFLRCYCRRNGWKHVGRQTSSARSVGRLVICRFLVPEVFLM